MLGCCSISEYYKHKAKADYSFAIVRSYKNPVEGARQVSVLSPSWSLFQDYRTWVAQGTWNQKQFDEVYAPRFIEEMKNPDAQKALKYIAELATNHNVLLMCYCKELNMCHRKLVADLVIKY